MDKLPSSEPSSDTKRVGEKTRPKPGLIVRGMMAGPTASSPQVVAPYRQCESAKWALAGVHSGVPHREPKGRGLCGGSGRTPLCVLSGSAVNSLWGQGPSLSPSCLSLPMTPVRRIPWLSVALLSENTSTQLDLCSSGVGGLIQVWGTSFVFYKT